MTAAISAQGLGKSYGRNWALSDCTLDVPAGRVVGLVGPNGAGKTTLLNLAVGMLTPTSGTIEVLGGHPAAGPAQLAKVGYVAQDPPTYAGLSVGDHLRLGARLNPGWDDALARHRIERLGLDLTQRAGKLSGGQRAQLALTLGVAKRPELLILDEPVASLDPLARREFLQDLMEAVAEHDLSVVLSSHLVSDLERVCDHLIVLVASRVQLAGDIDTLLATHHRLTGAAPGPRHPAGRPARDRRQPHRPSNHPAGPHRRPDPRPRLDRQPARHGRPRPGLHGPGRSRRPPPARAWRYCDDLADLASVPRLGRDDGRRARRARRHPGADRPRPGRRLLHRDRRLHQPGRRLLELRRAVLRATTGAPASPSPPSCWSCPPSSGSSGERR